MAVRESTVGTEDCGWFREQDTNANTGIIAITDGRCIRRMMANITLFAELKIWTGRDYRLGKMDLAVCTADFVHHFIFFYIPLLKPNKSKLT